MELNKDILRWVLLIGATPVWWPFLRALWKDFNRALREDGGLIGSPPTPRELEQIRAAHRSEFDPLTSEPFVQPGQRRSTRLRAPGSRPKPAHGSSSTPTAFRAPRRPRGR